MLSLRLAELMASLSLAIDLGVGQPMEWVIRCTLLATRLADAERFGDESQTAEGLTLDMEDKGIIRPRWKKELHIRSGGE
jgi:hypothetical protein